MDSNGDADPETGTSRSSAVVPYAGPSTQCVRARDIIALATTTHAITSPRLDDSTSAPAWSPGTTILELPNELLRDIFLCVDESFSRTLWSLSLTCKHFRRIVEEHCEPEYNLRGKRVDDPFALMERLKEQPRLKDLIRVVRINESPEGSFRRSVERTGTRNLRQFVALFDLEAVHDGLTCYLTDHVDSDESGPTWLISLLPRLETFEFATTEFHQDPFCDPSFISLLEDYETANELQSHGFRYLRNLTLLYPDFGHPTDAQRAYHGVYEGILKLPNLRTVKLDNVMFDQVAWRPSPRNTSSVRELHVQMHQQSFESAEYVEEWKKFTDLRKLVLRIEFRYVAYDNKSKTAPEYINCLSAQAQSLEDLQLYSNEPYCTSSEDEDPIEMSEYCPGQASLRTFRNLKSLVLTDMSLMGVSRTYGPTHWHQPIKMTLQHLANMFPPSLEVFTHVVWDGKAPFNNAITKKKNSRRSWGSIWKASDKKNFPNLKKVMVQKYGSYGVSEEKEVIWERK